jgi:hypothetical protein
MKTMNFFKPPFGPILPVMLVAILGGYVSAA